MHILGQIHACIDGCELITGRPIYEIEALKDEYKKWLNRTPYYGHTDEAFLGILDEYWLNNHTPALPIDGPLHYIP